MTAPQWPAQVQVSDASGTECVDVPVSAWFECVDAARAAGFDYFDWLTGVDQLDAECPGVDIVAHLVSLPVAGAAGVRDVLPGESETPVVGGPGSRGLARLLLRTRAPLNPDNSLTLASLTTIFAGAAWHERETFEMFGVDFAGFDDGSGAGLRPLLLPDGFRGTPLRKSFQLAARAARPWPGAKDPGQGAAAAPSRRTSLPPGVPDPATWGPRDPQDRGAVGGVG